MKAFLHRATYPLVAFGVAAFVGSWIVGIYIQRNRDARDAAYATVLAAAEKKDRVDRKRQQAAFDADAAKHPGAIAYMASIGTIASTETQKINERYDPTYFRLVHWQEATEAIAICAGVLVLFTATYSGMIRRGESKT